VARRSNGPISGEAPGIDPIFGMTALTELFRGFTQQLQANSDRSSYYIPFTNFSKSKIVPVLN